MFNTCTTEGILTIRKNLVCAGYSFEFFLSFLSVLRVLVWMPTQRQFAISNTRTDQLAAARLVTLMIYVYKCSGVARIWCQGGTKIEAPKAPSGVGYREGCPLPSGLEVWGSVVSSPSWVRGGAPAAIAFSAYFRPQNTSGSKKKYDSLAQSIRKNWYFLLFSTLKKMVLTVTDRLSQS